MTKATVKRFFVGFADGRKEVGIGDAVYSICRNGRTFDETIESFGNKYLTTNLKNQYEINTGAYKTTYQTRYLWSSKEAYNESLTREYYRRAFRKLLSERKEFTMEQIKEASKILGLEQALEDEVQKRG